MRLKAVWKTCASGLTQAEHEWRDHCWTCAPWWWDVPTCPLCGTKLRTTGYCIRCRKYYNVKEKPDA